MFTENDDKEPPSPPRYEAPQAPLYPPNIIINNVNTNTNTNAGHPSGRVCNKWISFLLCLFLGCVGAHKFYEGKGGMGVVYLLTGGFVGIGVLLDLVSILCKPNPYVVSY